MLIQLIFTFLTILIPMALAVSIFYAGYQRGKKSATVKWDSENQINQALVAEQLHKIKQLGDEAEAVNRKIDTINFKPDRRKNHGGSGSYDAWFDDRGELPDRRQNHSSFDMRL